MPSSRSTPAAHGVGGFDIELVKGVGMLRLEGAPHKKGCLSLGDAYPSFAGVDGSLSCLPGKSLDQRMGLSCCGMSISYTRLSGGMPCRELSKAARRGAKSSKKNCRSSS